MKTKEWIAEKHHLKSYPHFDGALTLAEAQALANDPSRVVRHTFYPFLSYKIRWTRFAQRGDLGDAKDRPISYACRADSVIFSRYRSLISELYERELQTRGLSNNVIAYRKIKDASTSQGKSNIHFARDAFQNIRTMGDCYVITMDIKSYFNSIDHLRLKTLWCQILNVSKLPDDHYAVFRAVTKHSSVDKMQAYERLGFYGVQRINEDGVQIKGYLKPKKKIPMRLCSGVEFRQKIAVKGGSTSLIKVNQNDCGIPQGSPISDVLANLNLLEFDSAVSKRFKNDGGVYLRYCDDLMFIIPGTARDAYTLINDVAASLPLHGSMLKAKTEKTTLHHFYRVGQGQFCSHLHGRSGSVGLEYLGFRFNGKHVYLKDGTLANYQRKMIKLAYRLARKHVGNNLGKTSSYLIDTFDLERYRKKFGRVERFAMHANDVRTWTFRSYVKKASEAFGKDGHKIMRQLRRFKKVTKDNVEVAIRHELDAAQRRGRLARSKSKGAGLAPKCGPTLPATQANNDDSHQLEAQ